MGEARQTQATSAYAALREIIITGEIPPGSKLNIRALCERLDTGLSPIREALNRLSSEGLVTHSDQRGFTVTGLDIKELADLTRARCWINEIGLRQSIAHGGDAWEEDLLLAFHRMNRIPRLTEDPYARAPAWAKAHMIFHRALVCASGSAWITRYCDQLFEAAERYRFAARHAERPRVDVASEHEAILNAAIRRDADQAVALLNAHFDRTAGLVRQTLQAPADR
jgi:DNA-binding GntR family transcriptional regulator